MAKFFNEEDLHTVFIDGFARGKAAGLFSNQTSESNWEEYLKSNPVTFRKESSKPITDSPVQELKCPICQAKMISRTNRQSGNKFWGCSKFPQCKGTRDEMGLSREEREMNKIEKQIDEEYYKTPAREGEVKFRKL